MMLLASVKTRDESGASLPRRLSGGCAADSPRPLPPRGKSAWSSEDDRNRRIGQVLPRGHDRYNLLGTPKSAPDGRSILAKSTEECKLIQTSGSTLLTGLAMLAD